MPQTDLKLEQIIDPSALRLRLDAIGGARQKNSDVNILRPQIVEAIKGFMSDGRAAPLPSRPQC